MVGGTRRATGFCSSEWCSQAQSFPSVPASGQGRRETESTRSTQQSGARRAAEAMNMTRGVEKSADWDGRSARGVIIAPAKQGAAQRPNAGDFATEAFTFLAEPGASRYQRG